MIRLAWLPLLFALGCAHAPRQAEPTSTRAPVDLVLRTSDGRPLDLADYRNGVVLVAMLGTYDTPSQAALESLSRYARHHDDVFVLVILAQQGADRLADAYATGAHVTFPITYCPDDSLLEGRTGLGPVGAVPSFLALDARGRVAARHEGFLVESSLEQLVERARSAAPLPPRENLPLLGTPH